MEYKFCNKKLSTLCYLKKHVEKYHMKVEPIDKITMKSNENGTNLMNDKNEITSNLNEIKKMDKKPKAKIQLKSYNDVFSKTRLNRSKKIITNLQRLQKLVADLKKYVKMYGS